MPRLARHPLCIRTMLRPHRRIQRIHLAFPLEQGLIARCQLAVAAERVHVVVCLGSGILQVHHHRQGVAERFQPGWDVAYGAPEAMVYALWSRLAADRTSGWAGAKTLAVDGLRFLRSPPAGELLRGRLTIMGKDPVGDERGVIIAQQDLLDEAGRLIFSCLTRAVFLRR